MLPLTNRKWKFKPQVFQKMEFLMNNNTKLQLHCERIRMPAEKRARPQKGQKPNQNPPKRFELTRSQQQFPLLHVYYTAT